MKYILYIFFKFDFKNCLKSVIFVIMTFNSIVGNPPYQKTLKSATIIRNNINTINIFGLFRDVALNLSNIVTLIYPAKEYQRGKDNFLNYDLIKVRIYNGSNKKSEKNIPNEKISFW